MIPAIPGRWRRDSSAIVKVAAGRAARLAKVIDLKAARQDPDGFRAALARREAGEDFDELLAADASWREATERAESLRAEQKKAPRGSRGPGASSRSSRSSRPGSRWPCGSRPMPRSAGTRYWPGSPTCPTRPPPTGWTRKTRSWCGPGASRLSSASSRRTTWSSGRPRGWIDMARGARLSGSRFAYRIGDVARHRDGALPVRPGQAARQGVPDRAAADPGRRAGHVRHRFPADRGVQPVPAGAGRPVPDRDVRGRAGRDPRRRAAGGGRAAGQVRGLHHELQARGRRGGQGHQGHVPGAPVRQGRDVRLLRCPSSRGRSTRSSSRTRRRSPRNSGCPTGS